MLKRLALLTLILFIAAISIRAQAISYENPIAYIGRDGNVYLTDLTDTVAITDDAYRTETNSLSYTRPTWSHDGQILAYASIQMTSPATSHYDFYIMHSGEAPRLVQLPENISIADTKFAISPDAHYLVFMGSDDENGGVFIVNLQDATVTHIFDDVLSGVGGPSLDDPAVGITRRIRDFDYTLGQRSLIWSETGFLYLSNGLYLFSTDGTVLWESEYLTNFLISPDGSHAVSESFATAGWVDIDLLTGETNPLNLPENALPLGWIGDQLYYRTQSNTISVQTDENFTDGVALFGYDWGYFSVTTSQNTILAYSPDADDTPIIDIQGYDIATISGVEDTTMLVRYVTSNVPAVLSLYEGTSPDELSDSLAREMNIVVRIAYKGSGINAYRYTTIPGNQSTISNGEFSVNP